MKWQLPSVAGRMVDSVKPSSGGSQTRQRQIYLTASVQFISRSASVCLERDPVWYICVFVRPPSVMGKELWYEKFLVRLFQQNKYVDLVYLNIYILI